MIPAVVGLANSCQTVPVRYQTELIAVMLVQSYQNFNQLINMAQKWCMVAGNVLHGPSIIFNRFDKCVLPLLWERCVLSGHNVGFWYIDVPTRAPHRRCTVIVTSWLQLCSPSFLGRRRQITEEKADAFRDIRSPDIALCQVNRNFSNVIYL